MKKLVYLIILLLSISLVSAVEVSTDKTDYSGSETVSFTISDCVGTSIVKVITSNSDLADIKSGQDNWATTYNTQSDSADGKYTVSATCTNGVATKEFCVDSPGCTGGTTIQTQTSGGSGGSSGSGGGFSCISEWTCSDWSYCNKDLQQLRDCVDQEKCSQPKQEARECSQCEESWICSLWSECVARTNTRSCVDEHQCGTQLNKPSSQKACTQVIASGPKPSKISTQLPPSFSQPSFQPRESALKKLWDDYKYHLLLGFLALLVLIVIIFLLLHFIKPKKKAFNVAELKEWVKKERAMGTTDQDIRQILLEHTGWTEEEVDKAFNNIGKSSPILGGSVPRKTEWNQPVKSQLNPTQTKKVITNTPSRNVLRKTPVKLQPKKPITNKPSPAKETSKPKK